MIAYIKKLIDEALGLEKKSVYGHCLIKGISQELNRLDPRDFVPEVQADFVSVRSVIDWASKNENIHVDVIKNKLNQLSSILDKYGGEGSKAVSRPFNFILDQELRSIIERDYRELSVFLFPMGAWKSCVIMSGSILEAILYGTLRSPKFVQQANASSKAPKGKDIHKEEWRLQNLIEVAADIGVIPQQRADTIDQVIRDYRNFVHPNKEIRSAHPCTEAEALLAKGALDGICNYLENKNQN